MVYFLSFGVAFIALHTISILFVTRISLVKRLFLAVWMMLFVVGAPFLYSILPTMLFVGVCVLVVSLYLVLLFSQELAPAKGKASFSRGRRQKRSKGRRRREALAGPDGDLTEEANFVAASASRERKGEVLYEGSSALQQAGTGQDAAEAPLDTDMTTYRQGSSLYAGEQLATVPAFEGMESDYQQETAAPASAKREDYSQTANDEFLESLLHLREGTTTKIKVSNSLIADAIESGELDAQGYTDIEDPVFETAVMSKIRPLAYAESDYGGARPFASEVSQVSGEIYRKEEVAEPAVADHEEPAAEADATGGLESLFSLSAANQADTGTEPAHSQESVQETGHGDSLESLFYTGAAESVSGREEQGAAASSDFNLKPVQADLANVPEDTQELFHVLDQMQMDLLGSAEAGLEAEPTDAWADLEETVAPEPAPRQVAASVAKSEDLSQPAANESEEDLLKEIAEILKAEEAAEQGVAAEPAAPAKESEEDLLKEIAGILGGPAQAEPAPAVSDQSGADKEVYYQFLLLESQELLASRAYQEAETYLKEILIGSSDQKIRQEALNMLDKLEKI